jgi:hypothetical protein
MKLCLLYLLIASFVTLSHLGERINRAKGDHAES